MPEPQESSADREKRERRARQEESRRLRELLGTAGYVDQGPSLPPGIAQREALLAGLQVTPERLAEQARNTDRSARIASEVRARREREARRGRVDRRVGNVVANLPEFISEPLAESVREGGLPGRAVQTMAGAADALRIPDVNDLRNVEAMEAFGRAGLDMLPAGLGDELTDMQMRGAAGMARSMGAATPYDDGTAEREAARIRRIQTEHPTATTAGRIVGALPAAALLPAASAPTVTGRVVQAGTMGGALSGVQGYGTSDAETPDGRVVDALQSAGYGIVGGAGGQLVGEALDAGGRLLRGDTRAPRRSGQNPRWTDDEIARIEADPELRALESQRSRTATDADYQRILGTAGPGVTRSDLEVALDYPGGTPAASARNLAQDIRDQGIVRPEDRTLGIIPPSRDVAQQRAEFAIADTGRAIRSTERRMTDAVRDTPGLDADPALVDMENVAETLRQSAREARATRDPQAMRRAAQMERLADSLEAGGPVPFGQADPTDAAPMSDYLDPDAPRLATTPQATARDILNEQRRQAGYARRGVDAARPYAEDMAREAQRAIRREMDAAMERTLTPEEMAQHLADRRRHQTAQTVARIGDRANMRIQGNRQVPLSDNIQVATADGIVGKAKALLVNRLVRGREHAFMADFGERRAQAMTDRLVRRLSAENPRAASALAAAMRRGPVVLGATLGQLFRDPATQDAVVEEAAAVLGTPEVDAETETLMREVLGDVPAAEDTEPTDEELEALAAEVL